METVLVGVIGVAAAGYIVWRGYKALEKKSDCASGSCARCSRGCGCGAPSSGSKPK